MEVRAGKPTFDAVRGAYIDAIARPISTRVDDVTIPTNEAAPRQEPIERRLPSLRGEADPAL
jgi:hypothetical protein